MEALRGLVNEMPRLSGRMPTENDEPRHFGEKGRLRASVRLRKTRAKLAFLKKLARSSQGRRRTFVRAPWTRYRRSPLRASPRPILLPSRSSGSLRKAARTEAGSPRRPRMHAYPRARGRGL